MDCYEKSSNKRASYRCAVPPANQRAELYLGATRLPVWLLDESAEGLAVQVDRDPGVQVDSVLKMRTCTGWFEVRVVHVTQLEPATTESPASGVAQGPAFRMGLQRLRELAVPEVEMEYAGWCRVLRWAWAFCSRSSILVATALGCLLFGLIPVTILAVQSHQSAAPVVKWLANQVRQTLPAGLSADQILSQARPKPQTAPPARSEAASARPSYFASGEPGGRNLRTESSNDQLRRMIEEEPGAAALLLPAVVRQLGLSDGQQEQIRQIVDQTDQQLQQFDAAQQAASDDQGWQQRSAILRAARREALKLLSWQQRAAWHELLQ